MLLAGLVIQVIISIPPIRVFTPYPSVKCPKGYSLWWPSEKEFQNDRYAQCVKYGKKKKKR